ncbi:hypothetical protein ACFELO_06060 [Oceanicaulis sp. LC35]|uniref:hypothetical protein n=1 Tax=Oceanicaulis sp. LC35 TaxID=3349635 RepID=UPI003F85AD46
MNEIVQDFVVPLISDEGSVLAGSHLNRDGLDYSEDSLKFIDAYLGKLHLKQVRPKFFSKPVSEQEGFDLTVIRTGAYVGEVLRRSSDIDYNWFSFKEWIQENPENKQLLGAAPTPSTVFVLSGNGSTLFPLAKVEKAILNGPEDNVSAFVRVLKVPLQGSVE